MLPYLMLLIQRRACYVCVCVRIITSKSHYFCCETPLLLCWPAVPNLPEAQTNLYAADTWLTTMTNVAAKHGISKQFGGCVSSMFLHSVTLPSVKSARKLMTSRGQPVPADMTDVVLVLDTDDTQFTLRCRENDFIFFFSRLGELLVRFQFSILAEF